MLEFLLEKGNWKMGKHGNSVVMLMILEGGGKRVFLNRLINDLS